MIVVKKYNLAEKEKESRHRRDVGLWLRQRDKDGRGTQYTSGLHLIHCFKRAKESRLQILSFSSKWMELENIILSKVSQAQKTKNCMFSLICRL
jgi:hypothetical protein